MTSEEAFRSGAAAALLGLALLSSGAYVARHPSESLRALRRVLGGERLPAWLQVDSERLSLSTRIQGMVVAAVGLLLLVDGVRLLLAAVTS